MAERYPADGAAANGFGRRSLHEWEGRLLYEASYPAPSDFRGPPGWRLSAGDVPIPPPPEDVAMVDEIQAALAGMDDEERGRPERFPENIPAWNAYFRERYDRELASYDGPPPPPARYNRDSRRRWWSVPGRTLQAVLEHIEAGNSPMLTMPAARLPSASRRRGSSWTPRRMASTSSSSASGSRSSGSAPPRSAPPRFAAPLLRVKPEAVSPPRTSARGGGIVIREREAAQAPHAHLRLVRPKIELGSSTMRTPKKEPADEWASTEAEDEFLVKQALEASLNDVPPMPLDQALAWSRQEWEREEAERQRRLLEEAAQRRGVIVLDDEDDWEPRPTCRRIGDAGQGSSRRQPATPESSPQDDDDEEDGGNGDYTEFYRQLGM